MRSRPAAAAVAFVLALLLAPADAWPGWRTLSARRAPERVPGGLLFRAEGAVVSVTAVSPGIVRVRCARGEAFGRDHSYAVVAADPPSAVAVETGTTRSRVATPTLGVEIGHAPLAISVRDASGRLLDEDDPARGIGLAGEALRLDKRLPEDTHVYGLGEKAGPLDKRGRRFGGSALAMWATDVPGHDAATDPLYVSVPFYLALRGGVAHGVFLDSSFRSSFDVGKSSPNRLAFEVEGGELDYYLIAGPSPKQVIERYTALTGRMPLPPRWALGFHQCRWSYVPEARVREIAAGFRRRGIPADALWLDIDYQDGFKPFTWDREQFPDPERLVSDLRALGFRTVVILDPHPKKEPGYAPYDSGLAGGHFVTRPDGSVYEGSVWPVNAKRDPGPSVFPDFSRPATRDWWGGLMAGLVRTGVAGIWNDMNEPAVFDTPSGTLPLDVRHDNEGQPSDHREIHNVYGMLMSRATHEGLRRLRPGGRPFVLTRASFAGGQRYAAVWTGDNTADWASLRGSLPMLMGLGVSGFAFVGADIGGFMGMPSAELYTRWLQAGIFSPFMRAHSHTGLPDKEPWAFGERHTHLNRRAIELRYALLPHLYSLMEEASRSGLPVLRPLVLEFPSDPASAAVEDELMLGSDLLAAPVLVEGATERELYLPPGEWFDFWTAEQLAGGVKLRRPVTLESIPLFARAGAFVFRQGPVQHSGEAAGQPLIVDVFPAARSEGVLYEDDGSSFDYQRGSFARRRFVQSCVAAGCTIEVEAAAGAYATPARPLLVRLRGETPRRIRLGADELPRRDARQPDREPAGWNVTPEGVALVTLPDRGQALALRTER